MVRVSKGVRGLYQFNCGCYLVDGRRMKKRWYLGRDKRVALRLAGWIRLQWHGLKLADKEAVWTPQHLQQVALMRFQMTGEADGAGHIPEAVDHVPVVPVAPVAPATPSPTPQAPPAVLSHSGTRSTIAADLDAFLAAEKASGMKDNTFGKRQKVKWLLKKLDGQTATAAITYDQMMSFVSWMKSRPAGDKAEKISASTVGIIIGQVKLFFDWAEASGRYTFPSRQFEKLFVVNVEDLKTAREKDEDEVKETWTLDQLTTIYAEALPSMRLTANDGRLPYSRRDDGDDAAGFRRRRPEAPRSAE